MSLFTIGVESHDGESFSHDIDASDMQHALSQGTGIASETTRKHGKKFFLTSIVAIGIPTQEESDDNFTHMEQDEPTTIDQHGPLVTWRTANGCMAVDVPRNLVTLVNNASGVNHSVALRKLEKLLTSQFDKTPQQLVKEALGDKYQGNRVDYLMLTRMACRELGY